MIRSGIYGDPERAGFCARGYHLMRMASMRIFVMASRVVVIAFGESCG